jgi:hypothetical protein
MLLTPHTLVGMAIGASVQNPIIAFPISVGMHFAGDLVPHWDFFSNTGKEERRIGWRPLAVMAELILAVSLGITTTLFALWVRQDTSLAFNIFICGIGSVLPDALEGPHIYMTHEPKILQNVSKIQSRLQFQAPLPWGIITQILVAAISLLIIAGSLGL